MLNNMEKDSKFYEEFTRIFKYFENLKENEKAVVLPLIQNAAFMRVTLDDLQEIIAEQGPVEQYQNGANQFGTKQSAALQSYNATMKVYAAVIKNLFGLLPSMDRPKVLAPLEPKEKTEAEWTAELKRDEERQAQINAEIQRAAELQRRQRG